MTQEDFINHIKSTQANVIFKKLTYLTTKICTKDNLLIAEYNHKTFRFCTCYECIIMEKHSVGTFCNFIGEFEDFTLDDVDKLFNNFWATKTSIEKDIKDHIIEYKLEKIKEDF